MKNLIKTVRTELIQAPLVSGTSTNNLGSNTVDMQGFDGCRFTCIVGNSTAVAAPITMTAQGSASTVAGEFSNFSTNITAATTVSNVLLQLDVFRSAYRYLRVTLNSTLGSVIGGVIADKYAAKATAVTQSTAHVVASSLGTYCST